MYEQEAVSPLSLRGAGGGGVWGHTPPENFEISKPYNAISSVLDY